MKLLLFDVDGTLAKSTLKINKDMKDKLKEIYNNKKYEMCIVGGGDYNHIINQIGIETSKFFTFIFSENGLVTYKNNKLFHKNNIRNKMGEDLIKRVINYTLKYIANLNIPFKRGSFIRFRNGMLYITPIGGDCNKEEREYFDTYDKIHNIRGKMIKDLLKEFGKNNIDVLLGGQIGIGLHPKGWDKSYILKFINIYDYESINFYGDRCTQIGNDYPLYSHKNINGFFVKSPKHTLELLNKLN